MLSDADLPSSVTEIQLEVQVAGRRFRESYPPEPNLQVVYEWDGLDAYGRVLRGRRPAVVRVGYAYDAIYGRTGRFFATNYGAGSPGATLARDSVILSREIRTTTQ